MWQYVNSFRHNRRKILPMYSYARERQVIGELVKQRRQALRLTQVQLGERTGLTQDYISKLERGTIDMPQRGTLQVLGRTLDIPMADFFRAAGVMEGGEEPQPSPPMQLALGEANDAVDIDAVVAYVESRPGIHFQDRLAQQRKRLARPDYIRFCLGLFRAWSSNSDLALTTAEMTAM